MKLIVCHSALINGTAGLLISLITCSETAVPIRTGSISLYFPDCLFGEDRSRYTVWCETRDYVRKISTWGGKWFKSSAMISSSQSVWSVRFTARMEMVTWHHRIINTWSNVINEVSKLSGLKLIFDAFFTNITRYSKKYLKSACTCFWFTNIINPTWRGY